MRALDLRQKILFSSTQDQSEDTLVYENDHIQKLFLCTVETGLQDENVRVRVRGYLGVKSQLKDINQETEQARLPNLPAPVDNRNQTRKTPPKCLQCQTSGNDKCSHCFICGSDNHFAIGCRQNRGKNALNSRRLPLPGPEVAERSLRSQRCSYCGKDDDQMTLYCCAQCKCIVYCSKNCQKKHWNNHRNNCKTLRDLTWACQNKPRSNNKTFTSHLTPSEHAKIAKLVGRRCTVKCSLNEFESTVLWDTGAQVSIVSKEMMEKHFPKNVIKNISELINGELDLTAANGTRIAYSGWTEIEVRLISSKEKDPSVMVPFLVTNDSLEYPILGYNVIEELIKPINTFDIQSAHIATVQASFQGFDEEVLLELVRLMQTARANELCTIKSPKKDLVIPAKKTFKVNCRANTGPVEETTLVLFEPDELTPWPGPVVRKAFKSLTTV